MQKVVDGEAISSVEQVVEIQPVLLHREVQSPPLSEVIV